MFEPFPEMSGSLSKLFGDVFLEQPVLFDEFFILFWLVLIDEVLQEELVVIEVIKNCRDCLFKLFNLLVPNQKKVLQIHEDFNIEFPNIIFLMVNEKIDEKLEDYF